ncbi:adenosylcobinamide-GDP ribazoletransferase [Nonomuraea roseoviolacea]|uniref:Adenosylcobinamide-GDP ribazoletransferase n=1 Tax=Nonomuraea roseoviolacea subsp. carminata TaxID=160689 RepID=A0ABT1JRY2_9ACTN|nr:adenosylcobinamide-GDP ribazoletransferase [Nonomuraea roseoviolacea]MCP2344480.1 adenosylcobinamide-GDP ribazoletransferase [Nonomuraea roseoviolacea subsp. carminata]
MRLRGGSPGSSAAGAGRTDGLRLAVGLLTIFPVRVPRVDRRTAGAAMGSAPVVGLVLGLVACLPLLLPGPPLLGAVLAVGALAVLTRGLHLDGLADLADGLGSGKPADQALDIMKKSDIGPFGVMTLVITLLAQIAALTAAGPFALVTACVTGRLALVWACRSGVPAARPGGLGATVAGTVRPATAWRVTAAALIVAALAGVVLAAWTSASHPPPVTAPLEWGPATAPSDRTSAPLGLTPAALSGWASAVVAPIAMAAGLGAALLLLRRARRRLGGVTGDVLGALVETATTAALVVWAVIG